MATTRLTDVYEPHPFDANVPLITKEKSALFRAGIVQEDAGIRAKAQGEGKIFDMPKLTGLGKAESNVGNDDPASQSTPEKIGSATDQAIKHFRNQSWEQADLVAALSNPKDPLGQMMQQVGGYWSRDLQKTLIAALRGVFADNEANDGADMVHSVATDATGTPSASEKINHTTITRARLTMGDALDDLSGIAVHSTVYGTLLENDNIDFIEDSEAGFRIPMYGDLFVVVDDGIPAIAGTNRITYHNYLFGRGAIGYGEGAPRVPSEVERHPDQGNGEGVETLYSRKHYIMHPMGIKFTNSSVASASPTNTELQNAANWDRVYPERKQIPMALLKTNG